jgi:hypothetical protein
VVKVGGLMKSLILTLKLLDKLRDIVVTHTPDYCYPDNSNGLGPFVNGFIQNGDDTLRWI